MVEATKYVNTTPVIASYPFVEVREGIGVTAFYGGNTEDNAVKSYFLTTNTATRSSSILTEGSSAGGGGEGDIMNIDFDVKFNRPNNMKGVFRCVVPWVSGDTDTANRDSDTFCIMKVSHVSANGTATQMLLTTKSRVFTVGDSVANGVVVCVEKELTKVQHFKAGETLRLNIELKKSTAGSSGAIIGLCHDPNGRVVKNSDYSPSDVDEAPDTSSLILFVPFVIDIA